MSVVHLERREGHSSSIARHLRQAGFLPMAIVHPKGAPELVKAKAADVKKALHETPGVGILHVDLPGDKEPRTVLVKHVDYEPVTKAMIHMTLQEVHTGDMVKISVPLVPVGENRPVFHGDAVLMRPVHHLRIRCHVDDVPPEFDVDVSHLKIGETVKASEIAVPAGVEVIAAPDEILFYLKPAKKAELTADEEPSTPLEVPTEPG